VAGARRAFTRRGYVKTRIKDIVAETGYTETILFSHFDSKEAIFNAAIIDPLDRHVADMAEQMDRISTADHRTRQRTFVRANERMLTLMSEVVDLLGVALFSDLELGRRYYNERLTPLFDRWVETTEKALDGWSRPEVTPRLTLTTLFGMHFGHSLDAVMRGEPLDVPAVAGAMGRRIYDGARR
jgi:AcrR family transcriptional regulator